MENKYEKIVSAVLFSLQSVALLFSINKCTLSVLSLHFKENVKIRLLQKSKTMLIYILIN